MIKKSISLTVEGKKELEKELDELIKGRPAIAEKIATARAFGDLSENEEYSSARNEQKMAENLYGDWLDIMSPEQADMYYVWACEQEDEEAEREADELAQMQAERMGAA